MGGSLRVGSAPYLGYVFLSFLRSYSRHKVPVTPNIVILGREMFIRPFYLYLSCTWIYNLQFLTNYVVLALLLTKVQVTTTLYYRDAFDTPSVKNHAGSRVFWSVLSVLTWYLSPYIRLGCQKLVKILSFLKYIILLNHQNVKLYFSEKE